MESNTIAIWRARRDSAIKHRSNASYPQRMLVLAVAKQIRKELREEKRKVS